MFQLNLEEQSLCFYYFKSRFISHYRVSYTSKSCLYKTKKHWFVLQINCLYDTKEKIAPEMIVKNEYINVINHKPLRYSMAQ